jgi:hypothetical protein
MSGFVVKQIDEQASIHGGIVKLAGAELGVERPEAIRLAVRP